MEFPCMNLHNVTKIAVVKAKPPKTGEDLLRNSIKIVITVGD